MKLKNTEQLKKYITDYGYRIEQALVYSLEYLVEELVNHAKINGDYQDQTSNLRSSIGGVVLKDGKPIQYRGFEGGGQKGNIEGMEYINGLIEEMGSGYVLLVVAGMNYATYVENIHGLNVLKKTEMRMKMELPEMLNKLKNRIQ